METSFIVRIALILLSDLIFVFNVSAQLFSEEPEVTLRTTRRVTAAPTVCSTPTAVASPCRSISSLIASQSANYPEEAVPLAVDRSSKSIDYVKPYIQFQSTITYLKDPPKGYTLPGVDVLGGLDLIQSNIKNGVYKNQWSFEKDLYQLINVLPHDFHFNLPLPLVGLFTFATYRSLVSVSEDGLSLPAVYFKRDLDKYLFGTTRWTPLKLSMINGEDVTTFLETIAVTNSASQDADAIYNQLFYSPPQNLQGGANLFYSGARQFGFESNTNNYTFANGSSQEMYNFASLAPGVDSAGIVDGTTLFQTIEVDPTTDVDKLLTSRDLIEEPHNKIRRQSTTRSIPGYPDAFITHPEDPYTAGYFLDENSEVAVLRLSAFSAANSSSETDQGNQQTTIALFLAECKQRGSTKLIVDLSANGGGSVFSGYDACKRLFRRLFHTVDLSALDTDLKKYPSWKEFGGPFRFHGDNFLAITRANLSDPLMTTDFSVAGYLDEPEIPVAAFAADDIVVLYDGSCGSTCAIFAEFMKNQGGVRSIAVGGRPQDGLMQGIGGSKGSQVLTDLTIEVHREALNASLAVLEAKKANIPEAPAASWIPPDVYMDFGGRGESNPGSLPDVLVIYRESDT
ncbi:hypothetical protein DL98DRAFT_537462 [Cadophora sp. DSE1049]|nr:hypothetical protein DL98DRAFT_537462 [Cadophora sp. DSE1049]